jgi:prepilin signal peptidase PulO-like enzyme (type II secretory pathway)
MDFGTLAGLIFMLILGPAVGNYACSVVYRLPRGQTPFEKKPYCGHCGTMLQPVDLFPILSFLRTRGKCRYCGGEIRTTYFWIEVICLLMFIAGFLLLGMSQSFLLVTAFGVFLTILAFIDYHEGFISNFMLTLALAVVGLLRALNEHTVYPWFLGGFIALFLAAALWQLTRKGKGTLSEVPRPVWLALLIGASLPGGYAIVAAIAALAGYGLQRVAVSYRSPVGIACAVVYLILLLHEAGRII